MDAQQSAELPGAESGPVMPPDYKKTSIVMIAVMLCLSPACCCLGGIPPFAGAMCAVIALVQSANVSERFMRGDVAGAEQVSRRIRAWLTASILVPIIVTLLMGAFSLIFLGAMDTLDELWKKM